MAAAALLLRIDVGLIAAHRISTVWSPYAGCRFRNCTGSLPPEQKSVGQRGRVRLGHLSRNGSPCALFRRTGSRLGPPTISHTSPEPVSRPGPSPSPRGRLRPPRSALRPLPSRSPFLAISSSPGPNGIQRKSVSMGKRARTRTRRCERPRFPRRSGALARPSPGSRRSGPGLRPGEFSGRRKSKSYARTIGNPQYGALVAFMRHLRNSPEFASASIAAGDPRNRRTGTRAPASRER